MACKNVKLWFFVFFITLAIARPVAALQPEELLDFCLNNSDKCAFSINHLTEGWERHWNADRLQSTASTYKILTLIAYAEAVVGGRIDPGRVIDRDEWARFWVGGDGGALSGAWDRLGQPQAVTVDEIVRAMIRESDNAAPDWLLNELGERALKRVVRRFIEGYHDIPESINSTSIIWNGNPIEPGIGSRILNDYSGFEVVGYQKEIDEAFDRLQDPDFVEKVLDFTCIARPWDSPPSPCTPGTETSTTEEVELIDRFDMRSTTRTYNRLMAGLLRRDLLRPRVFDVVRPHLEFLLEFPDIEAAFTRFGTKNGILTPNDLLNLTTYMESRDTGDQVAVTIFMHRLDKGFANDNDLTLFTGAILFDPNFAAIVQEKVPEDYPKAELVPRLTRFKHNRRRGGDRLAVTVEVTNVGTAPADGPFEVSLFLSDDNKLDAGDEKISTVYMRNLKPTKKTRRQLIAHKLPVVDGKFAIVAIDASDTVVEGVEDNNVALQVVR